MLDCVSFCHLLLNYITLSILVLVSLIRHKGAVSILGIFGNLVNVYQL